jgi:signal transduction histidine kinase
MTKPRPTVLILASDPAFAREITAHWPQDPPPNANSPEFIVLGDELVSDLQSSHYDLAIADASFIKESKLKELSKRLNRELKQSLRAAGKPAIWIHSDPSRDFYNIHGDMLELRRVPGVWPAVAGLVGREILHRAAAEARAREAKEASAVAQSEATLGRYMLEMRTNINNVLTTVLGNTELLMLEPGLPSSVQGQADAIRNMALRLHEVFQRFSSLEKELNFAARDSGTKKSHAAAAGR